MSISLPNGTILAAPTSSSSAPASAAVTRILHLANFSADLKTRDLQAMFKEYEGDKGGFRIKWMDDTNALVVFGDANTAKKAYLSFLLNPPAAFVPPAVIRPYDRPDAQQIIQSLAARAMGHRTSASTAALSGSVAADPGQLQGLHGRAMSMAAPGNAGLSGFVMPTSVLGGAGLQGSAPISGRTARHSIATGPGSGAGLAGSSSRFALGHGRSGSASSSWARGSMGGGGALNFSMPRTLPTHTEGAAMDSQNSSSSSEDPLVLLESNATNLGVGLGGRRSSLSADKALSEVKKALASVEAQG